MRCLPWNVVRLIAIGFVLVMSATARADGDPELVDVRMIWEEAPHNAFTDLIRYKDRWVCAFREAPKHAGGVKDSSMRVIVSDDTQQWESAANLTDPRGDIRDAKLCELPDGRLMLLTAIQLFDRSKGQSHQSIVYLTNDLKSWQGPIDVADPNVWTWGVQWHDGAGYSIGYGTGGNRFVRLYRFTEPTRFETLVERLEVDAKHANESAMHFDEDGTARVLLRCDPDPAFIGSAKAPYTQWTWKPGNLRVGGPALTRTPDGRLLGAGRLYEPKARTSLFWIDPETAELTECLTLPSGGDTSYPGFVWQDDVLYMSYYSSHEGKSRIYLARIRFDRSSEISKEPKNDP